MLPFVKSYPLKYPTWPSILLIGLSSPNVLLTRRTCLVSSTGATLVSLRLANLRPLMLTAGGRTALLPGGPPVRPAARLTTAATPPTAIYNEAVSYN